MPEQMKHSVEVHIYNETKQGNSEGFDSCD